MAELVSATVIVATFVINIGLIAAVIYRRWKNRQEERQRKQPRSS